MDSVNNNPIILINFHIFKHYEYVLYKYLSILIVFGGLIYTLILKWEVERDMELEKKINSY